jgi:hypothetical protein
MIYLTDQVRTLIYSQGNPRNSDSFSLVKVSMAMGIHLTGFKKGPCFSLHGLVLHPGNNNPEVADDPHQEYWKGIWCLPSEQICHCKEIFEPDSICFVDDYAAAEHVLQKLKKGAFNFQMRRRLKEQYDVFYGPLKHRLHYTPRQPYSLWTSFLNIQVSGMERRNFVPAPEFALDLRKKRTQADEHRWIRKESPIFEKALMIMTKILLLGETHMLRMFWPIIDHNPVRNLVL